MWYYSPNSTEGIKFDDSRDRDPKKGLIFDYGISPIIQGWNLGIKTMNQGGVRSIIIPPYLGYGNKTVHATGRPSIPGNSELVFELELLAVKNNEGDCSLKHTFHIRTTRHVAVEIQENFVVMPRQRGHVPIV